MNEEDYQDLVSKVFPMHLDHFRKMLGVNEVPVEVLEHYMDIKKIIDKIDAPLRPFDLLRIAVDCGFNVKTCRFEKTFQFKGQQMKHEPDLDYEDEKPAKPDKGGALKVEPEEVDASPEEPKQDNEELKAGDRVGILHDGEFSEGRLVGVHEELGKKVFTFDPDDGTGIVQVPENEIRIN